MPSLLVRWLSLVLALLLTALPFSAQSHTGPAAGVVIMHGKGGDPNRQVNDLARALERKGYVVANLDMPWSGRRGYDAPVAQGVKQIEEAIAALRAKGAAKVFVAGHSQGGVFGIYASGVIPMDGVIAIAPGGDVSGNTFRSKLGSSVDSARKMVAEGRGDEKASFEDYEGSKGTTHVRTTAAIYLDWFDPQGAMSFMQSISKLPPALPVLFVAPTGDYPALRNIKQRIWDALPKNPQSKLVEPRATHLDAPGASAEEIDGWIRTIATASK